MDRVLGRAPLLTVTDNELISLVVKMRKAQQKYFRLFRQEDLAEAKELERRVDYAIRQRGQHAMFSAPKEPTP